MQKLSWYFRRIQSMDSGEILWRIRGAMRDQADLARIPLGLFPRLPRSGMPEPGKFSPGFRCSPAQATLQDEAEINYPSAWREQLLETARDILDNRLSYFDLDRVDHGKPMNWHRDHSAGIEGALRPAALVDYREFAKYGDCKLVWEPNRHHQLVVLARAYRVTGNRNYVVKIAELLRSWIEANPFGYGMNWKSPLELGVRLINWVWALDLVRDCDAIDAALWHDIEQFAFLAVWDCQRKISRGSSANNHTIGEAAGVFVASCYFQHFPHAKDWAREAQLVLENEIEAQTYEDGCSREHAFGYQFFVLQFFSLSLLAGDAAGFPFSGAFRRRLQRMYEFQLEISADCGRPPNSGDADDGYVLDLGDRPENALGLLAVGGRLFPDSELQQLAASETVFWMFNETRAARRPAATNRPSKAFTGSGYFVLRSPRFSVFFDCAPLGYGSIAAHGHADCLAINVAVDGHPVFVDPGTYDYFSYPEWRRYFRETRAHCTAEIDGRSQSEILGPFLWGQRAEPSQGQWHDSADRVSISGEHDGYTKLADPVVHQRHVELHKDSETVMVTDRFKCESDHRVRLHLHLHPDCRLESATESTALLSVHGLQLALQVQGARLFHVEAGNDEPGPGWISEGYHRRLASTCLVAEKTISGPEEITTTISILDSGTS